MHSLLEGTVRRVARGMRDATRRSTASTFMLARPDIRKTETLNETDAYVNEQYNTVSAARNP